MRIDFPAFTVALVYYHALTYPATPPPPAIQVPLEFMVDISPDRHSIEIDRVGLQSIRDARALLDRELLKGKTLRLRRAGARGEEEDEEGAEEELEEEQTKQQMAAGRGASTTLLQEMESAKALFFVVEEPSSSPMGPAGPGAETGAATGEGGAGDAPDVAPSSSHDGGGNGGASDGGNGGGSAEEERKSGGGGRAADGEDGGGGSGGGGGSARATAGGGDYSLPYWGILRVGEQTNDPGDKPEPWPLYGVSGDGGGGGFRRAGGPAAAAPRSHQLPPPAQVHRPAANAPNSVGYRIVFVNVKVSVHHPKGSRAAADKDAVIDGVTRVRKE